MNFENIYTELLQLNNKQKKNNFKMGKIFKLTYFQRYTNGR